MLVQVKQCDKDVAQSSSVQLIHALQEVTKLSQRLHEVHVQCTPIMLIQTWHTNTLCVTFCFHTTALCISMQIEFELHQRLLDKENQDLMHLDVLG